MRKPTQSERSHVEYYLDLSVEQLSAEVGLAIGRREGVEHSPKTAVRLTERWLESKKSEIQRLICDEWDYCAKRKDRRLSDRVNLVVIVSDLLITVCGGLPLLAVASLIVKIGLDDFCNCDS